MREVHDVAVTYQDAFQKFQEQIESSRREWAAKLLREYPDRELLRQAAEGLRVTIGVDAVEVNSVTSKDQATVAKSPGEGETRPISLSLCALTAGSGEALMVSDIENDPALDDWEGQKTLGLKAWASTPIMIEGSCAGTVCALETVNPRKWTEADQFILEGAARRISALVNEWLPKADKTALAAI